MGADFPPSYDAAGAERSVRVPGLAAAPAGSRSWGKSGKLAQQKDG
jgi:hypothetical protein